MLMPRGRRPSIAALTRLGARKASEMVRLTCRTLHAYPLTAAEKRTSPNRCLGPTPDSCIAAIASYSITSSALASNVEGMLSPSALAVLKLIASMNFVGW
jgi:hypothetical protein